jgi:hypothetical protein
MGRWGTVGAVFRSAFRIDTGIQVDLDAAVYFTADPDPGFASKNVTKYSRILPEQLSLFLCQLSHGPE